jgi:hypothetical protein
MLFSACNSSGLRRTGFTDGSSSSDGEAGGTNGQATGGATSVGTTTTGGITSSGGSIPTAGGITSSGGSSTSGGVTGSGGATISGGSINTAGATSSGGVGNSGAIGSTDNGRGVADYVSPDDVTAATCSSAAGGNVNCATGAAVTHSAGNNFLIYWDADELRELEDGTSVTKASGETLLSATDCSGNNGAKDTPTLTADLLGDWREELVLRETSNAALRLYTTTAVTTRRIYRLMYDPTYRAQVAFEQSSYNQPPHVGFHIGAGMAVPPKPDIHVR